MQYLLLLSLFAGNSFGISNGQEKATCSGTCKMFMTASVTQGSFGGVLLADSICQNDLNRPPGDSIYKALFVQGLVRRACLTDNCSQGLTEQIDWVLKPNTIYTLTNGMTIGTTDSLGLLNPSLTNAIGAGGLAWTGISFRTTGITERWMTSSNDCLNWTDVTGIHVGESGQSGFEDERYLDGNDSICSGMQSFYCVEQ